jgi:hypothetical protein
VVKFSVKFIKNNTIYATWEFIQTIDDKTASGAGSKIADIDGIQPIPDRYRVEIYWQNQMLDDLEKYF